MKNDLTATKHELLKIRDMLEMAEKVRFFLQFKLPHVYFINIYQKQMGLW